MLSSISANPKITKLYKDVPEDSLNRLVSFRERYPYQTITLGGWHWKFIDSGEGKNALFIPAGGTTIAEISFNSLEHFAASTGLSLRIIHQLRRYRSCLTDSLTCWIIWA